METRKPLWIQASEDPAMVVLPTLLAARQVAYLLVADAHIRYPRGRSQIAYIGTTYTGFWRLASSTAERASRILRQPGVNSFRVVPVRAEPRRGLKTWELLEKSLLAAFRERYGRLPKCNKRGGSFSQHFAASDVSEILQQFE